MYIVTGATGHIGNNVVRYLIDQNEQVKVLIRKKDPSLENLPIEISESPQFDDLFLNENIQTKDIVIHAAGHIDLLNADKMQTFRTNYQLTKKIADICLQKKVRLIYISSVDIIEKSKKGIVEEPQEIHKIHSKYHYKASKSLATKYILDLTQKGLSSMILYPSAVIGPHDYKPSAAGKEIKNVMNHRILFSLRGGYNFIDVRDVAKAIYKACQLDLNETIILSGYNKTIKQLYQSIKKDTNQTKLIIPIPIWLVRIAILFTPKYTNVMINSLRENYHYSQIKMKAHLIDELIPFDKTIHDTIEWLKQ